MGRQAGNIYRIVHRISISISIDPCMSRLHLLACMCSFLAAITTYLPPCPGDRAKYSSTSRNAISGHGGTHRRWGGNGKRPQPHFSSPPPGFSGRASLAKKGLPTVREEEGIHSFIHHPSTQKIPTHGKATLSLILAVRKVLPPPIVELLGAGRLSLLRRG